MEKTDYKKFLTAGIIRENPVLRLALGTCPTLAVTTSVINGIGMGAATTFVLLCSNMMISLLRRVIPDKVRIPAYITIIAGFVSVVQMLMKAYTPSMNDALGIYLPLITVNCIILARAETFAGKNRLLPSALDAVGMGAGFTGALVLMGAIRELIGAGSLFGIALTSRFMEPMIVAILPPGGFFVFGVLVALANFITRKMGGKPVMSTGCENCHGCGEDGCAVCGESCALAGNAAEEDLSDAAQNGMAGKGGE